MSHFDLLSRTVPMTGGLHQLNVTLDDKGVVARVWDESPDSHCSFDLVWSITEWAIEPSSSSFDCFVDGDRYVIYNDSVHPLGEFDREQMIRQFDAILYNILHDRHRVPDELADVVLCDEIDDIEFYFD